MIATAIDRYVGLKLKVKRSEMSITQGELGYMTGVTFQQIQKYEKGQSKIVVSKLCEFADVLNVPVNYFFKVPQGIEKREVFLLDPMLATGGSACDAIELLKEKGVKKIKFLCIISAPEGLEVVKKRHPDVEIYTAHIDRELNKNKYICPGLGDAGDRIFGTK